MMIKFENERPTLLSLCCNNADVRCVNDNSLTLQLERPLLTVFPCIYFYHSQVFDPKPSGYFGITMLLKCYAFVTS